MKTYICTCGTSIATKRRINLERFDDVPISKYDEVKDEIEATKERISEELSGIKLPHELDDTSAEIKSLVKMGLDKNDIIILISSDTIDGKLCAESVRDFLVENKLSSETSIKIKEIVGLQATDGLKFQKEGLKNLLDYLVSLEHQDIIFNPTGGYKSIVPYLALMGMLFNKPVKYIHENSDDILTLTGIPIILDDNLILCIETKLQKIEKETSIPIKEWQGGVDYNERRFDCLVEIDNGQVTLSGIGFLFWERFKQDYPKELERDLRLVSEKENKLLAQGIDHHGLDRIKPIARELLESPFVCGVPNSCNNQPKSRVSIKALAPLEAKVHLQRESSSICMVTDIRSDAGYSFLIKTTARDDDENKQIAEILNRKYFKS
ncbi:MAG: putative CRISPR-associated protein [Proteobacteria bacterium]|nr:putative CRISPR-associated protein [Pseudomonadota bacterium]